MRGRRTRIVRVMAAAGVAATVVGLLVPGPRLWAQQKAEPVVEKKTEPEPPPGLPATRIEGAITEPRPEPFFTPAADLPQVNTTAPTARAVAPAAATTLADPEAAAKAFVERSQKEADEAINALSKEAESLRQRLEKVEAGLARWQAVKESLGATDVATRPSWRPRVVQGGAVVPNPLPESTPTFLEPLPPPRGDKAPRRGARSPRPDESGKAPRPAVPDDELPPPSSPARPSEGTKADDADAPALPPKGVVLRPSKPSGRVE